MLAKIKSFFEQSTSLDSSTINAEIEAHQRLACAALLIEVAIIDQEFDDSELQKLSEILEQQFDISAEDSDELIRVAKIECEESTSMYQFTQLVNKYCSNENKFSLLTGMWQIAFADGELDKYEEYIIRKVADLIHLGHGEFIRAKHHAKQLTSGKAFR
ncbi:hypothetical protein TDB9533_04269 [Thalassocella blandensis]|nr:hypothetical protein TDB9533_04269 [Thalassocella blandensis]